MANKMLIDASHQEETRVVVLRGNRVEEFDFEAASRKQLRGNIYLAKVTRVEPSLQAAFVEYGGNRHGFLAFSEIHPDYYQIPVADRQALLEAQAHAEEEEEEETRQRRSRRNRNRDGERGGRDRPRRNRQDSESVSEAAPVDETAHEVDAHDTDAHTDHHETAQHETAQPHAHEDHGHTDAVQDHSAHEHNLEPASAEHDADDDHSASNEHETHAKRETHGESHEDADSAAHDDHHDAEALSDAPQPIEARDAAHDEDDSEEEEEQVEQIGGDALGEVPRREKRAPKQYKIQEVIKRRQVLLIQVVKEERGNKGAALTTYLSLAGRYSVLMPNTARGGGISRKITDSGDRKRLKTIAEDLEVPEGMGVILRTAGASRTKQEVRRDFEYLLRMWETVREATLRSSAPTLVYEEGSLIKRAIRDLYGKEVDEVVVSGEEGYREAKEFMRLLMPSHARNVVAWREEQPLFVHSGVESQLDAMFSSHVTLRSGGYIVINQTEALVAIDVNSGRSTREHNIEDTALRTNMEAADEVARQLRLRDLAGLIVVDFIDMEEPRNNRAVEGRIKNALKNDRARIQVGRISHFGLLEMSRQRIRTGVLEGSSVPCPHCAGAGMVRSTSSIALHVLRTLEENLVKSAQYNLIVNTRATVALYILNQKRAHLSDLEMRFGVTIMVLADETLTGMTYHALERGELATGTPMPRAIPTELPADDFFDEAEEIEDEALLDEADEADGETDAEGEQADQAGEENGGLDADGQPRKRRRRRRRGGRGSDRGPAQHNGEGPQPSDAILAAEGYAAELTPVTEGEAAPAEGDAPNGERTRRERRPRGRGRGGQRGERNEREPREDREPRNGYWTRPESDQPLPFVEAGTAADADTAPAMHAESAPHSEPHAEPQVTRIEITQAPPAPVAETAPVAPVAEAMPTPVAPAASAPPAEPEAAAPRTPRPRPEGEVVITAADPDGPKKGGWWSRAKATLGGG